MTALKITEFQHDVMKSMRGRSIATGTDRFPWHTMNALRNQGLLRFDIHGGVRLSVAGELVLSTIEAMEKIEDLTHNGDAQ